MAAMISALLAVGTLLAPGVKAHGWIEKPLARQFCNGNKLKWSVSISGGNGAGGVDTNYGGVPGFCGDTFEGAPPKSTFVGLPCDPQETYQAGGIMSMQIDIAANHGGFFEVSVCDSKDISQACFDKNKLKTVSHDAEQWHIMDRKLDSPTDKRPDSYFMDWKIPAGLTCGHCVVMWSWWTAHNCVFPCEKEICGFYADRKNEVVRPGATWDMKFCDSKTPEFGQQPQMFRNCADIKIEGSGMNPTTPPMAAPPTETPPNTTSTPPLNVVPKPETGQPTEEPFMEQADCSMPRRLLLDNEVLEEEDNVSDVSGAGNEMGCSNLKVEKVLMAINQLRKKTKAQPLECSNRAVGVSENFSDIMCNLGKMIGDSVDNCNLAGFAGRCLQVVADGNADTPLDNIPGADLEALLDPSYAVAGTGYYSCSDKTYWTIMIG